MRALPRWAIALVLVLLVAGVLFWSLRQPPAEDQNAGSVPAAPARTLVAEPVAAQPADAAAAAAPTPSPAVLPPRRDARGRLIAPPGPAARPPAGEPADPLVPAAPGDGRLGGGKGAMFDPLNSGLRRN